MKLIYLSLLVFASYSLAPLATAEPSKETVVAHAGKLDQLLTLDETAKIIGKPADKAHVEYAKDEKRPYTEVVSYSWDGGRKRVTTGTPKMELPVRDSVVMGWLRKDTLDKLKALRESTEAEDLVGLGEFAFLVKSDQQYIIYNKGIRFSIWINISDDPKVNQAKALEIAKLILPRI